MSVELENPQPIEGQSQDQPAHDAGQVQANPTTEGGEQPEGGDKPKPPRMVPVTALQQERQRRQQEAAARRELEARIAQIEASTRPQHQAPAEDAFPDPSKFESREAFEAATRKWASDLARREAANVARSTVSEELQGSQAQAQAREVLGTFQQRIAEAEATIPDIVDRVQDLEENPLIERVDHSIRMELLASEVAPQLIQALTDDPRLLAALTGDPVRAARTLSRLEATLAQRPVAASAPQVSAKPTTTVKGSPVLTVDLNDPNAPEDAWMKARAAQENKR